MNFEKGLLDPLLFFTSPSKRLYFIYLMSSFLIAIVVLQWQNHGGLRENLRKILNKKFWFHSSALLDYKLFFLNSFLKTILFSVVVISSFSVAREVLLVLQESFPHFEHLKWSHLSAGVFYTLVSFLLLDFSRFFQHYCMHKIPFLWRFHQIHHSAIVLTPMTLYRTHPVESLISSLRRVVVIGFSTGLFVFLFGAKVSVFDIIGINVIGFFFNLFGSNLRHSHIWLSFGPLNYIFISPAQHQIHHSRDPKYFDKNFGIVISLWDQLFGSFYHPAQKENIRFGLPRQGSWGLKKALLKPFEVKTQ